MVWLPDAEKNIALSCTVFSYLTLNNIVTLKFGLEVIQGYSNWYHLKVWMRFPIHHIVTTAVSLTVYEIFSVEV